MALIATVWGFQWVGLYCSKMWLFDASGRAVQSAKTMV